MNLRPLFKGIWSWTKRNSTKLLAAGAITAEAFGFYFMHREAPVVRDRLEELGPDAKWIDKLKAAGPVYLPAAGMFILSAGCIVGGCAVGEKKAAIMASLYSMSEATLRKYEQEIVEKVGEKKAKEIHDSVVEDLAKENPPIPSNVKKTGKGDKLFFERRTGQWFASSYLAVRNDEITFNQYLLDRCGAGLDFNEWLDCLGAERAVFGDYFGFNVDHRLKLNISSEHQTEDGEQYYILDYVDCPGFGPVMYNGKKGLEFRRSEDCYIDD